MYIFKTEEKTKKSVIISGGGLYCQTLLREIGSEQV